MGFYAEASLVVIIVSVGLVLLIRRNLRQRPMARRFRASFIRLADELVGNPDFPEPHAKQLVTIAKFPEGWLTRVMVALLLRQIVLGKAKKTADKTPIEKVPEHLRATYVAALFALAIGDSYRCALLGRIWRGANAWILDAVKEPDPDVNGHAARRVIQQVSNVQRRHHARDLEDFVPA
ncbi:MAG: hypothetical protein ACJ8FS_09975 [Sphingomicrobium sp.]